ncbi:MAG: hypothetical protein M1825_003330 [Sarcosagium campestre]|nr:MAG: hypothetical protein M1825_003330 [Sarcosagium campestre]
MAERLESKDADPIEEAPRVQNAPLTQKADIEHAPDPDEDDLDDLDDLLDEFSEQKISSNEAPPPSGPGRPKDPSTSSPIPGPNVENEEEFAKDLQAGMADLLGGLEQSPEMQQQFESLVKELGAAAASPTLDPTSKPQAGTTASAATATEDTFQETIRRTMQRMQESGSQATAAAASAEPPADDILSEMLKQMQAGAADPSGGGPGSDDDFSAMLLGMMEQLTNKEILYDPMKELHDKFPAWMAKHRDTVAKDDLKRYEEQQRVVADIVARFEADSYSDDRAEDREYIVERMQKMQAAGSPPADLVGDMGAAKEALEDVDQGCPQQ